VSDTSDLLDEITAQEAELVFDAFGLDDAWALGSAMRAAAAERGHPVVIRIVLGRQVVFQCALPGSSGNNELWLDRKSAVALLYNRSSFGVGEQQRVWGNDVNVEGRLDPERYAAHGGVFPIQLRGTGTVGVVGVSGLPQAEDHAFVVEHLRAHRAATR
jgi:uncharacterized protein (UPF0303 family)